MVEALPEVRLGALLRSRGLTLAVGESCTGGLVSHRITNMPGSSSYFLGGIVAYSNEIKERLLGVSPRSLEMHGAVSEQVALEMARGAQSALGADVGIAVTGIAGPGGGTPDKPVGLTWVAVSGPQGELVVEHRWRGGRAENKERSASAALKLALALLEGK
ncbi:MAG TPA: CinA family protein [Chloroflexi bacterium]|nr:CinA family protein [Chloroflexota bacterium]